MWYVMQVRTGLEENIRLQCQREISSDVLKGCFIPYYEEKRHIKGEWRILKRILFPGYVFLNTEELELLCIDLKHIQGFARLLRTGDEVIPLTKDEVDFLETFSGKERIVSISMGVIENSKVRVISGPLVGKEGYIKKIDRHKRKAYLEILMFERIQRIQVGLEIISKI